MNYYEIYKIVKYYINIYNCTKIYDVYNKQFKM